MAVNCFMCCLTSLQRAGSVRRSASRNFGVLHSTASVQNRDESASRSASPPRRGVDQFEGGFGFWSTVGRRGVLGALAVPAAFSGACNRPGRAGGVIRMQPAAGACIGGAEAA